MANIRYNQLSALKLKSLGQGTHTDGQGLTLRVADSGNKSWVLRITVDGKARNVTLGTFPKVGLADARKAAADYRQTVQTGGDPAAVKRAKVEERRVKATIPTFQQLAEEVIELRRPTWGNARHAAQWSESLTKHVYPAIGQRTVDTVTPAEILRILETIWTAKPETASRVKQRMQSTFERAVVLGYRIDNPVAAVGGALVQRKRTKQHHPAIHHSDAPAMIAKVRASTSDVVTKLAYEFLVLTAARTGEVRGATWSEINLDCRAWEIPASRMKMDRPHRVPLADRAMTLLGQARQLTDGQGLIFPNKRTGKPLSNAVFQQLLGRLEIACVAHGMRATFKGFCDEDTGTPNAVSETALAHVRGDAVEAAYSRSDLFTKRRELMQVWANFLTPGDCAQ